MIISIIQKENFRYFNLHAEEVMSSNYIKDDNQGIYITSLQYETIARVFTYIKINQIEETKFIVLDFENILHLQANILDKITEIRDLGYQLVFINVSEDIVKPLSLKNIENFKNIPRLNNGYDSFYFFTDETSNIYDEDLSNKHLFYNDFKYKINKYIQPFDKKHASSSIYLHSFVDLKKMISIENPFIYFALYRLAMKIKEKWECELNDKPILVSQSLTSTFLVSILSKMLKLDILVFDKIGPITKLYKKLEKHNFEHRKYIIVSDLVCLGTEVKITKTLIEFSGGNYLGNVSLVKVETLSREDVELDNIDRTISVFSISDKNNVSLNYYIYTNLKSANE